MTMRKISIFAAFVVAMTAVSCVEDINSGAPAVNDGAVTFEASFGVMSKAVLEPGATESKVAWEAGDQVGVLVGEGNYLYSAATAGYSTTLSTEATGVPSEGTYYAVYPYDSEAVLAEGVITTSLPAEQTAVLGSFTTHLAVAQTTSDNLAFKNVCGLVKVIIDAENVTKVVFEGNSGEVVAGGINVTVSDTPSWAVVAEQGATSVTLAPVSGTLAKGAYYFAVLPQTFAAGFKVTAYKGTEYSVIRNVATEFTLERADIVGGRAFGIEGAGTEASPYILKTAQDMVDMRTLAKVGGETWFKMANDINLAGVNWVPVNYDQNFERKIHFDGGNFTISNLTCDKKASGANYPSLFGVLYGSCTNLKIDNAVITSSSGCGVIGGYVGTTSKPALLENVTITNSSVTNSGDRCGGVAGTAKEATIKNVSFQGTVKSTITTEAKSGAFVGQTETKVTFTDCNVNAVFEGAGTDIGGFVGKLLGENEFTRCKASIAITTTVASKNRCGGFIGWNASAKTTMTDCHVLAGSTITDASAKTAGIASNLGGLIGFGDAKGAVLNISGCSVKAVVDPGAYGQKVSGLIGSVEYASTVVIENSYVEGEVKSKQNYAAGLIGYIGKAPAVTITGCHFNGTVSGASSVAGLIGAVDTGGTLALSKSYMVGTVSPSATNGGGLVGAVIGATTIQDSWANVTLNMPSNQYGAGIAGGITGILTVKNCYIMGLINVSRGSGGIAGQIKTASVVDGCIAWCEIKTNRAANQYSSGAIVGNIQVDGTYKNCYRKADMQFTDVVMTLVDHENIENGRPPLPTYEGTTADKNQYAYHGKAAAADATISSVAKTIGWDETIWDLSGDVPVLK